MDILLGYSGLLTAFIIIAAIHLYFIIESKAKVLTKALIIPIVLWFSLVLFYTPEKLMGWPTSQEMPNNSMVMSMLIREPYGSSPGAIYILALHDRFSEKITKSSVKKYLNPKSVFGYTTKNIPRFYKLTYDRELHKDLKKGEKKVEQKGGYLRLKKGSLVKKNKKFREDYQFYVEYEDPKKLMPK